MIRKVQKETGRIVQVGTQQRSQFDKFTRAVAIAAEGRLGKIKKIQCAIGGAPVSDAIAVAEAPKELNWDRWLGPAPSTDFRNQPYEEVGQDGKKRMKRRNNNHYEFRWWYEYSGGKLTDWGAHHVDIAMWALRAAGQSDTVLSLGGSAEHPVEFKDGVAVQKDRYNTAHKFMFTAQIEGGVELVIRHDTRNGILIEGDKDRIFVSRGKLDGAPVKALESNPLPEDAVQKVYKNLPMENDKRRAHWLNFLHCHKQQIEPISDVESHMRMLNLCHLAGISARVGRDLKWDAATETIQGDDAANAMLARPYRSGYEIEMKAMAGATS